MHYSKLSISCIDKTNTILRKQNYKPQFQKIQEV